MMGDTTTSAGRPARTRSRRLRSSPTNECAEWAQRFADEHPNPTEATAAEIAAAVDDYVAQVVE